MKRILFFLTAIIFIASCSTPQTRRRNPYDADEQIRRMREADKLDQSFDNFAPLRPKLGILPLDAVEELSSLGPGVSKIATQELNKEVLRTQKFVIANSETLAAFPLGSSQLFTGKEIKLEQARRKARDVGLSLLLFGRVNKAVVRTRNDEVGVLRTMEAVARAEIELKLLDVRTGQIIMDKTYSADTGQRKTNLFDRGSVTPEYRMELMGVAARGAIRKFVPTLMTVGKRLKWRGRVAKIIGTRIYLNAGRQTGIQLGDILKVAAEGDDIYDPDTGAFMGRAMGLQKATLEIVEFFGNDGSIGRIHSGGNIKEGDILQLY
jgi:hypothetical protein